MNKPHSTTAESVRCGLGSWLAGSSTSQDMHSIHEIAPDLLSRITWDGWRLINHILAKGLSVITHAALGADTCGCGSHAVAAICW